MLRARSFLGLASLGAILLLTNGARATDAADADEVDAEDAASDIGGDAADADAVDAHEDAEADSGRDTLPLGYDTGSYAYDADFGDACWFCDPYDNGGGAGCGPTPHEPDGMGCRCDVRSLRGGDVLAGIVAMAALTIALRRRRD